MNLIFKMIVVFILFASGLIVGAILGLTEKPKSANEIVSVSFSDTAKLVEFAQPSVEIVETTEPTKSVEVVEEVLENETAPEVVETSVVSLFPETLLPTKEDLQDEIVDHSFRFFEEEPKEMICELSKPVEIHVNVTNFGGSGDKVVTSQETGSVGKNRLRSLDDKKDLYIAWPMPGVTEKNPNSPLDLPCVESFFANGETSAGKRIFNANKGLRDYYAKIVYVDKDGNEKTVFARVEDRGPRKSDRFDVSRAVSEKLGLCEVLKGSPSSESNKVTLTVSLVHKDDVDPEKIEETYFASRNSDDKTKWYGPQGKVTEQQISEIHFSKNAAGKKFQLPSWDQSEEETTKIASNP